MKLTNFKLLDKKNKLVHGVLIQVYQTGVLLIGKSGIGKSELALELINRGHYFIADDVVKLKSKNNQLTGKAPKILKNLIHARGLGLLNIAKLFNKNRILKESKIDMIIELIDYFPLGYLNCLEPSFEETNLKNASLLKIQLPTLFKNNLSLRVEIIVKQFNLIYTKNRNEVDIFSKKQKKFQALSNNYS